MPWPTRPRTEPAASPVPRGGPAIPSRTDPASPDARCAFRPARGGPCPRCRATWGRPASRPAPARRCSVVGLLQLLQHAIDALRMLDPAVQMEVQLGTRAQGQLVRELRAQVARRARESLERLRL